MKKQNLLNRTLSKLNEVSRTNKMLAFTAAGIIAISGFILFSADAANYFTSVKFSNGSSGASSVSDNRASGNTALKFGEKSADNGSGGDSGGGSSSSVKPNASTVGPRKSLTRTLSAKEALDELRQTKKLSGVIIQGKFTLRGDDGKGWVIEDSRFEGSLYAVKGYLGLDPPYSGSQAERPILRYVDIVGPAAKGNTGGSSSVVGSNMVIRHANIYGSVDGIKASSNLELHNSWIHDLDHPSGAHCDALQIRSGTGILIKNSRFDAYVGYSSDNSGGIGNPCSGGLQTGSVISNIQATFEGNWFAGGHYTIRGVNSKDAANYDVDYTFRNNKWMRHGTSVVLNRTDLKPHTYGPVAKDLVDFDSSNVWEDTGQPIR